MDPFDVYRILREELDPWCEQAGYLRIEDRRPGWGKPVEGQYLVFWFRCSSADWDEYAGSEFAFEAQVCERPLIGMGADFKRLADYLYTDSFRRVKQLQNEIIARLPAPPDDYPLLQGTSQESVEYLAKFQPMTQKYAFSADFGLRYHNEADVRLWGKLLLELLPGILSEIAHGIEKIIDFDVIENPHNRPVVLAFMAASLAYASPSEREHFNGLTFSTVITLDKLRTHPDLGGAMEAAAKGLDHISGLIAGYHVLVNKKGVIFAFAMSMNLLMVRVEPTKDPYPYDPGSGGPKLDFGPGWSSVNPWGAQALQEAIAKSLAYCDRLADIPVSQE